MLKSCKIGPMSCQVRDSRPNRVFALSAPGLEHSPSFPLRQAARPCSRSRTVPIPRKEAIFCTKTIETHMRLAGPMDKALEILVVLEVATRDCPTGSARSTSYVCSSTSCCFELEVHFIVQHRYGKSSGLLNPEHLARWLLR